jgi:hypothetical protein
LPGARGETTAMFADIGQRSGGFDGTRRPGAAALVAVLAALPAAAVAASPAVAQTPPAGSSVYVQSAKSGELRGSRLTLHGVSHRVTWAHNSGRAGVMAVRRLHRLLFARAKPAPTGTLHVAGHRGGDELTFRLSRPRYNRARRTVSYRAKPLTSKPLPGQATHSAGAARHFGAASLSIIAPQDGPTLQLGTDTYTCNPTQRPVNLCFGSLSATGLKAKTPVTVATTTQQGAVSTKTYPTDANGNLALVDVQVACDGAILGLSAEGITPSGGVTSVAAVVPSACSAPLSGLAEAPRLFHGAGLNQ